MSNKLRNAEMANLKMDVFSTDSSLSNEKEPCIFNFVQFIEM